MKILNRFQIAIFLALSILILTACGLMDLYSDITEGNQQTVEEQVQGTLTAIASEKDLESTKTAMVAPSPSATVETPTATEPSLGTITGELGYPSEYIPPLRVVAFDVNSADYYYVETLLNQSTYEITDLPAGTYHVLAYVRDEGPGISAGYSQAVPCGLTVDCNDHSLIDVLVYPGEVTEGVDPIDYYIQPEDVDWPEDPTQ